MKNEKAENNFLASENITNDLFVDKRSNSISNNVAESHRESRERDLAPLAIQPHPTWRAAY